MAGLVALLVIGSVATISYFWVLPQVLNPVPPGPQMLAAVQRSVATVHVVSGTGTPPTMVQRTGSGFFIDSYGHLLTNAHVLATSRSTPWKVTVTKADGTNASASLVGLDEDRDVAELQVDGPSIALPFAPAAPDSGQHVFVVRNSLGGHSSTALESHITSLKQTLFAGYRNYFGVVVVTDVGAEPENSGSPVVDERGRILGMMTTPGTLQDPVLPQQPAGRAPSFFIPKADLQSDLVAWGQAHAKLFEVPPPSFRPGGLWSPYGCNDRACSNQPNINCGVQDCSLRVRVTNWGGPGRAQVMLCVNAVQWDSCDPGRSLATCSSTVTLQAGKSQEMTCTASSQALREHQGRLWATGSVQAQESVPIVLDPPIERGS